MAKNLTARASNTTYQKRYVIIFREGTNSEPKYIDKLEPFKNASKSYKIKEPLLNQGIGKDCEQWLKKCFSAIQNLSQKVRQQTDSIWFVFDNDGRVNIQKILRLQNKKIENIPVYIAFSTMCIEYWFLLHFCKHNGNPIYQTCDPDHSAGTIKLINQEIVKCNKTRKKSLPLYAKSKGWIENHFDDFFLEENNSNPLKFLEKKPRIVEAFVRAKQIHETKIASGNEFEESVTTFYKLLEYLGVVYYKDVIQDPDDLKIYDVVNGCYSKNREIIKIQDTNLIKNEPYFNR